MSTTQHRLGGSFIVPSDHPCLPGHFPFGAIAPAVLLLDLGCAVLRGLQPQLGPLLEVKAAKFTQPVLPGETVRVDFETGATPGLIRLSCSTAAGTAVQAQLRFAI